MNKFKLKGTRTDLKLEQIKQVKIIKNEIEVLKYQENTSDYHIITFKNLNQENKLKNIVKQELTFFLKKYDLPKNTHFFIVGLGNENHTSDSIGPKTLKHLKVNAYLEELGLTLSTNKISALEPGVLGNTGIDTSRIIESVIKEIKPSLLILIDAFVTEDIKFLNKSIQITNEGLTPGSGLKSISNEISEKTLGIPVLSIGIPTAIEISIQQKKEDILPLYLSTKDIDDYVLRISKIIGNSLNEILLEKY